MSIYEFASARFNGLLNPMLPTPEEGAPLPSDVEHALSCGMCIEPVFPIHTDWTIRSVRSLVSTRGRDALVQYYRANPECQWAAATGAYTGLTAIAIEIKYHHKLLWALDRACSSWGETLRYRMTNRIVFFFQHSQMNMKRPPLPGISIIRRGHVFLPPSTFDDQPLKFSNQDARPLPTPDCSLLYLPYGGTQ